MKAGSTSLLAYVIDYLTEEHQRAVRGELPQAVELIGAEMVREMVQDAVDVYNGGAR